MFPSGYFQIGVPAPSQAQAELIAELRAIASRAPKAPAKTNQMGVAELRAIANRKPKAAKGNIKLCRSQIDKLFGIKRGQYVYGRTIFIK
jgi:hypothetical protein